MRLSSALSLVAVMLVAACGSGHKTTVYSANGQSATVTSDNGGKTSTFQNSEGKAVVGQNAVDTSKLGAPVYPGASQAEGGGLNVTSKTGSSQMVSFASDDSFDKVYNFYKGKMPPGSEKMKVESGGSSTAEFVSGDEKTGQTMVMVTTESGKTKIVITRSTKTGQ